jgi:cytidylate kinase
MPERGAAHTVVAVDGPSGSGKSSVSRAVASQFGYRYLDTGAMYRAVALWMSERGIDLNDQQAVADEVPHVELRSITDPSAPGIELAGRDVAQAIRVDAVTSTVSAVSAVPVVRQVLVQMQRDEVTAALNAGTGIVMEGRDIGTTVLPNADIKFFLTADHEARAQRRAAQDQQEGRGGEVDSAAASLAARDAADSSRKASPLKRADDAIEIDATFMTFDEVVQRVVELVRGDST